MNRATPVTIGTSLGWLHTAEGDRGVVMCAAMGYEGLCSHHSWRTLADRLAAAGLPTLRFDYPGEGDSLDEADDSELLERWRASIRDAVAWMRRTIGVRDVALVGLRLGASLAAEVGGVEHLVQIAPVVKGQSYLRELKVMSRMLAASGGAQHEPGAENEIALEGYVVSASTIDTIKKIDLTRLAAPPAQRILVMPEPASRLLPDYVARLEALGAKPAVRDLENFAALTPAPLPAPPPLADFEALATFLGEGVGRAATVTPPPSGLAAEAFVEQAMRFGPDQSLVGVLCLPRGEPKATVVLLNTGANYHVGCGRSAVIHARALARMGVASLRMDSLGIGESDPVPGGPRSVLYREERAADVSAALDMLLARGLADVSLAGVCSGATLAMFAAAADARVKGALLANIQVFDRIDDATIDHLLSTSFGATSTYVAKAMSARSWARVVSGEVAIGKLLSIGGALLRRKAAQLFGGADKRSACGHFATLSQRGAHIQIVHGDHDVGIEKMNARFGPDAHELRKLAGVSLDVVTGVDHSLASRISRDALLHRLTAFVHSMDSEHVLRRDPSRSAYGALTMAALGAFAILTNIE